MEFLGIGLPEIVIVLLVALIVVGPKRLPEVAVQVARAIRQLRGYATDVTSQMRGELDELTREYEAVRREFQEFRESAGRDVRSVAREVDKAVREAPAIIESSAQPKPDDNPPPQTEQKPDDDGS